MKETLNGVVIGLNIAKIILLSVTLFYLIKDELDASKEDA